MQQFEAIWSLQQAVEQSTFSAVFACQFEFDLALTHARSCLSVYTDIFTYTYTHTHTQMPVGVCVSSFISAAWLKFFWNYNCNINISFKFTHVACAPLSPLQLQVRLGTNSVSSLITRNANGGSTNLLLPQPQPQRQPQLSFRNICGVRKPPPQKINQSIDSARFRKCYKSGTLKYSAYQVDTHRKLLLYQFICYSGQTPGIYIFNFQNWQQDDSRKDDS